MRANSDFEDSGREARVRALCGNSLRLHKDAPRTDSVCGVVLVYAGMNLLHIIRI